MLAAVRWNENGWTTDDSLEELARLAESADLEVVGSVAQNLSRPNPTSYLGKGKVQEVKAARERVGICDVSTLGKIDVQGSDAADFLNPLYCNGWSTLEVGKARYGLMLREDGIVFDDGTTSRLAEHRYFMTTTTANAAAVLMHLEHLLQIVWPELRVHVTSETEQWAAMALAGPR